MFSDVMHECSVSAWKATLVLENSLVTGSRFETKSNEIRGNLSYGLTGLQTPPGNPILLSPASPPLPGQEQLYCPGSCQVVLSTSFPRNTHIVPA